MSSERIVAGAFATQKKIFSRPQFTVQKIVSQARPLKCATGPRVCDLWCCYLQNAQYGGFNLFSRNGGIHVIEKNSSPTFMILSGTLDNTLPTPILFPA